MTRARVSAAYVEQLDERLSDRDRAIVEAVGRVRVMRGDQVERLIFNDLVQPSRGVMRRRVLGRLMNARVLTTLERRVGGSSGGSESLVYALDSAGQYLMRRWYPEPISGSERVRRPWTPGLPFLAHSLDVAELYLLLVGTARASDAYRVVKFDAEPACWVPNGISGWLKPDAYSVLSTSSYSEALWWEVERARKSEPTLRRKLMAYVEFVARGQVGPDGVIPRVVVTVPDERRLAVVKAVLADLPRTPAGLFTAIRYERAAAYLLSLLGAQNREG